MKHEAGPSLHSKPINPHSTALLRPSFLLPDATSRPSGWNGASTYEKQRRSRPHCHCGSGSFWGFEGFTLTLPMSKKGLEFPLVPSFLLGIMDKRIPQSITEPRWERKMDPVEWSLHQTSWHPADVSHWKIWEAVGEILPSLSRNYHPPGFSLEMFKDTRLCFRFHRFLYSICHTPCFGTLYKQEIQGRAFYELTNLSCCLPCPYITIDVMGLLVLLVQHISLSDRAETQKV